MDENDDKDYTAAQAWRVFWTGVAVGLLTAVVIVLLSTTIKR